MPSAYDAAQAAVADLVERFARNLSAYRHAPFDLLIQPRAALIGWIDHMESKLP